MDHSETLPVAKRPKTSHTATQPNASAVARFFDIPELVQIILDYLHADRIDLLVLAAVCKGLRTPALQVWVRHFDFNQDEYEGKLKLVQANTHLIAHIRCLCIFNCVEWVYPGGPDPERPPLFWSQVKALLSLLVAHRPLHDQGPLFDIFMDVDDGDALYRAFQPYPRLAQRISGLHLADRCRFTPGNAAHAANRFSTSGWTSLTLLLKDALPHTSSVKNLRSLEYKTFSELQEVPFRQAAKQIFWSTLAAQCQSLHELCLFVSFGSQADYLLRHGHFTSLKVFDLSDMSRNDVDILDVEIIDAFLNRHTALERLSFYCDACPRDRPLSLNQTFPALQDLDLGAGASAADEATFEFVRRHSKLRRLTTIHLGNVDENAALLKSLLLACPDTFKHLPGIENILPKQLSALIRDGARPLRAKVFAIKSLSSGFRWDCEPLTDLDMLSWSGVRPEDVRDLTFLSVVLRVHDFDRQDLRLFQLFACGILPNLTELHLHLVGGEDDFPTLTEFVNQIIPSTSIRVLCILAPDRLAPEEVPAMLLTRHLFPVRFELLCWRHGSQESEYFRFVADTSVMQNSASPLAPQLGKLGRLQAIPKRVLLTQVGSGGVWRQRLDIGRGLNPATVLDHNGV